MCVRQLQVLISFLFVRSLKSITKKIDLPATCFYNFLFFIHLKTSLHASTNAKLNGNWEGVFFSFFLRWFTNEEFLWMEIDKRASSKYDTFLWPDIATKRWILNKSGKMFNCFVNNKKNFLKSNFINWWVNKQLKMIEIWDGKVLFNNYQIIIMHSLINIQH